MLTVAETLAIRHDATLGPPAPRRRTGEAGHDHGHIWHNVATTGRGGIRDAGRLPGRRPDGPRLRLPGRPAGRLPEEIADEAYDTFNDHPRDPEGEELACAYYGHRLRGRCPSATSWPSADGRYGSLSPRSAGPRSRGPLTEVRTSEHGTRPLPLPGSAPATGAPGKEDHGE